MLNPEMIENLCAELRALGEQWGREDGVVYPPEDFDGWLRRIAVTATGPQPPPE